MFTIAITIYLKSCKYLLIEQIKYKVQYQKHKGLRFGNKFIRFEEKSSGVLSLGKFAGLPAAFRQRIMVLFSCEAVFGSTGEAEKTCEGYISRCFDGAVTSQFGIS